MIADSQPRPARSVYRRCGNRTGCPATRRACPPGALARHARRLNICMKIRRLTPVALPPIFARLSSRGGACLTSITVSDGRCQICDNPGGVGVTAHAVRASCKDDFDDERTRQPTPWMISNNKVLLGCRSYSDSTLPGPGESIKMQSPSFIRSGCRRAQRAYQISAICVLLARRIS